MRQRGFTFVELLVAISIIAILASILFPVFARARENARIASCASNLSQIGVALNMYAQNYDGHYPPRNNEFGPLLPYADEEIFYCPSDSVEHYWETEQLGPDVRVGIGIPRMVAVRTYSSYVYRAGLTNDGRADTIIAGEAKALHGTVANVLYLGGYVKGVPLEAYKPVVAPTQKPVEKNPTPAPALPPGPPVSD